MANIVEVVTLLRRQSEPELQLIRDDGTAVATENVLEATRRRLTLHPHALGAVLQTAGALRQTPDTVSRRQVEDWSSSS
jgi:hypothetical protein